MERHIKYFSNLIQSKMETLPRAIEGGVNKDVINNILLDINFLIDAKKLLMIKESDISSTSKIVQKLRSNSQNGSSRWVEKYEEATAVSKMEMECYQWALNDVMQHIEKI